MEDCTRALGKHRAVVDDDRNKAADDVRRSRLMLLDGGWMATKEDQ